MTETRRYLHLIAAIMAVMVVLVSCDKAKQTVDFDPEQIDQYFGKSDSVPRTADSLMSLGIIGQIAADVYLVDYYQSRDVPRAMEIIDSGLALPVETEQDRFYNFLLSAEGVEIEVIDRRYESGLHKVLPLIENADMTFVDSHYMLQAAYLNLYTNLAKCDINLERFDRAEEHLKKVMDLTDQYIKAVRDDSVKLRKFEFDRAYTSVEALIAYYNVDQYERTLAWIDIAEKNLASFMQDPGDMKDYCSVFAYQIAIMKAAVLVRTDRPGRAARVYDNLRGNPFAETNVGRVNAVNYLLYAQRYNEAVRNIEPVEDMIHQHGMKMTLDNLVGFVKMKFEANLGAGRRDSALAVATRIITALDSARAWAKRDRAAEMATLYDMKENEAQLAEKELSLMYTQIIALLITMFLLIVFFVVFSIIRHRAESRLAEVKAAKERIEGELQIAHDIQMSMVPHEFLHQEGLDMYASMTPAKEVGGDLYNYLVYGNKLYFCIGDVSGKGVPASLFMTLATRGFRTLALQGKSPAEIATRMNAELSENNEQGMFVTMFICRFDLKLCSLEYCNAGHNPPLVGNADGQLSFLDVLSNAPIGLWPELEFEGECIDFFSNRFLLLYTDGLNEAENNQQEQYGEDRIIELLTSLSSASSHDIIEALKDDVNSFREGAEPNDDLTMLAFRYS